MTTSEIPKHQPAGGIEITQSDLLQAASSMGPSVSSNERHRYQAMYVDFEMSNWLIIKSKIFLITGPGLNFLQTSTGLQFIGHNK